MSRGRLSENDRPDGHDLSCSARRWPSPLSALESAVGGLVGGKGVLGMDTLAGARAPPENYQRVTTSCGWFCPGGKPRRLSQVLEAWLGRSCRFAGGRCPNVTLENQPRHRGLQKAGKIGSRCHARRCPIVDRQRFGRELGGASLSCRRTSVRGWGCRQEKRPQGKNCPNNTRIYEL